MKTKPPSSRRAGFTLPEVVITGLLMTIMMIPVSRIAYLTIRGTQYAHDSGEALALAQAKLEAFSDMDYEDIESGYETTDGYILRWIVSESQSSKVVRLFVRWSILGRRQSINLNTIYTDPLVEGFSFE